MMLAAISKPLMHFIWFLEQATFIGVNATLFFAVLFVLLALGAIVAPWGSPLGSWRRLRPMIVGLPAIWIFVGFWGAIFWRDRLPNPSWVHYPLVVAPVLALLVSGFCLVRFSGMRLFTSYYVVVNLYFTLMMYFLASMAISGDWL